MSWLTSSVPSQWVELEPTRFASGICSVGPYGASSGASSPASDHDQHQHGAEQPACPWPSTPQLQRRPTVPAAGSTSAERHAAPPSRIRGSSAAFVGVGDQLGRDEHGHRQQQQHLHERVVARLEIACSTSSPRPGHAKIASTSTAPPSSAPTCTPSTVTVEGSALGSAWVSTIRRRLDAERPGRRDVRRLQLGAQRLGQEPGQRRRRPGAPGRSPASAGTGTRCPAGR